MRIDKFIRCPFCGEVPFPQSEPYDENKEIIICTYCGAKAPEYMWIQRNFEEKLLQQLQMAMEQMKKADDLLYEGQYNYASGVLINEMSRLREQIKEYKEDYLIWEK